MTRKSNTSGSLIRDLRQQQGWTLRLGRRTNASIRCAGVSLNTSKLDAGAARELLGRERERLGMPVADPMRRGPEFEQLVDSCLA